MIQWLNVYCRKSITCILPQIKFYRDLLSLLNVMMVINFLGMMSSTAIMKDISMSPCHHAYVSIPVNILQVMNVTCLNLIKCVHECTDVYVGQLSYLTCNSYLNILAYHNWSVKLHQILYLLSGRVFAFFRINNFNNYIDICRNVKNLKNECWK